MLNALHRKMGQTLNRPFFLGLIRVLILVNPLAIAPQVWAAFTAPSVAGISLAMYIIFAVIQTALVLEGIRVKSLAMFWSMLISLLESITIVAVVLLRS